MITLITPSYITHITHHPGYKNITSSCMILHSLMLFLSLSLSLLFSLSFLRKTFITITIFYYYCFKILQLE